jgi:1-phosphofructokinase family hexose kinase
MRSGVVAVSTNPAIDRVAVIAGLAGDVVHASEMLETPGGKAVHCALVAAELGADAAVITPAGGRSGDRLLELLATEPVEVKAVTVADSTRSTYTLVRASGGDLLEVHEPGGSLTDAECEELVSELARVATDAAVVAICGSLPPGARPDLHARLIATARELGAFTILDCSTAVALAAGIAAGPHLVAPNLAEAGELLDRDLGPGLGDPELGAILGAIAGRGDAAVWLSLGSEGSVLATGAGTVRLTAPAPDRIVSAVGCGDALVGGLAAGLGRGLDLDSAAILGVAAASQKLSHLHPGRVDRAAVEALVPTVEATPLRPEVAVR